MFPALGSGKLVLQGRQEENRHDLGVRGGGAGSHDRGRGQEERLQEDIPGKPSQGRPRARAGAQEPLLRRQDLVPEDTPALEDEDQVRFRDGNEAAHKEVHYDIREGLGRRKEQG